MKMLAALCLGVALCAAFSRAATFVPPGPLLGTQVWSAANSPYVIDGDVTIGMSGQLFIEAGVEVLFSSTDSAVAGVDTNRCELRVLSGQLTVSGTKTNPVIFRAISNSLAGAWYGITVTNGLGASISNAWIQDAFAGITVDNTNFTTLNDITLCSNRTGVHIGRFNTNTPASLRNLRVFQNTNGIVLSSAMNTLLRNSVVYSNFTHGVVARRANLINCTIQGNGFGVRCISDFDDDLQLNNCLFTSNDVAILQFTEPEGGIGHSAHIRAVHCAYWGNNVKLFENPPAGSTTGTNAVFGDPRYLNLAGADGIIGTADDNFRLAAGSACIDQGDKNFVANGPFRDFNDQGRLVDDPSTADALAPANYPPAVDIGACEYQPPLRIIFVRRVGANVDIAAPGVPGPIFYEFQYTHDFAGWTNLPGGFKADGLMHTQRDLNVTSPYRFYRVQGFP